MFQGNILKYYVIFVFFFKFIEEFLCDIRLLKNAFKIIVWCINDDNECDDWHM